MASAKPSDSVPSLVQVFRSKSQERSNKDYQDVIVNVLKSFTQRIKNHPNRKICAWLSASSEQALDLLKVDENIFSKLEKGLLPSLNRNLKALAKPLDDLTYTENDLRLRLVDILQLLVDSDDLLEQIELAIISIGQSPRTDEGSQRFTTHQCQRISLQIEELFTSNLAHLFTLFEGFFRSAELSLPFKRSPYDSIQPFSYLKSTLIRTAAVTIEMIDEIIELLQKSLLDITQDECQYIVDDLERSLQRLVNYSNPHFEPSGDEFNPFRDEQGKMSFQEELLLNLRIPVVKLCRIFLNKLSKPTIAEPLIFRSSSIMVQPNNLKELIQKVDEIPEYLDDFINSTQLLNGLRGIWNSTVNLIGGFLEILPILEKYWQSLLSPNSSSHTVDQTVIENALRWCKLWQEQFFLATTQVMKATGSRWPWQLGRRFPDEIDEGELDDFNEHQSE